MTFPLAAVPDRAPDVIVIEFYPSVIPSFPLGHKRIRWPWRRFGKESHERRRRHILANSPRRLPTPHAPTNLPPRNSRSRDTMVISEQRFSSNQVRQVLGDVLGDDLHAKRVASLCDATLGVLRSASLAVCAIGRGLAAARSLNPKHATKQVDRLLSNPEIRVDDILVRWVPFVVGARSSMVVALDWTDFDSDRQAIIMLSLITDHGRATPLAWLTVDKRTLNRTSP